MKYTPGGYSWLAVSPESSFEQQIEKLEDEIHTLRKEYEHNQDEKLLSQIEALQNKIKDLQKINND